MSPEEIKEGITLFRNGRYEEFNRFLTGICQESRPESLKEMVELIHEKYGTYEALPVIRRIGHHPHFSPFFETLPVLRDQGIFYANLPFLKTRVSVSLFDHPSVTQPEIDYTCVIYNQKGEQVFQKLATLRRRETHTYEVADLLKAEPGFGTFCIQSAERDLHSMRIYAYWYNENSITTTHEKKAYADMSPVITCPTVVCNNSFETYIAICNGATHPLNLTCTLINTEGENHPGTLRIGFKPQATCLIPLSRHFAEASTFLRGGPGVLSIATDNIGGLYYYFVHNKELDAWQIQHL